MQHDRVDIYENITNQIIALLEAGTVPWQKPWSTLGPPMNLLTRRYYTGVNLMTLSNLPFEEPYYLTFNQVHAVGGMITKGEKGQIVVFKANVGRKDSTTPKFAARYYYVFNVSQCKHIPVGLIPPEPKPNKKNSPVSRCESVLKGMEQPPRIVHNGRQAYYEPAEDYITIPELQCFESSEGYYAALFHELVHYTGHKTRLNRPGIADDSEYGSKPYSVEELVAEIGACYLSSFCKLSQASLPNSAAYIQHWLARLRNDKKFVIQASFRAQRAVDYILGVGRSGEVFEALPGEVI